MSLSRLRRIFLALLAIALLPLCSCRHHSDEPAADDSIEMPVSLLIPVQETLSRALPGDPGLAEGWTKPTIAYVYMFTYFSHADAESKTNVVYTPIEPIVLDPKNWIEYSRDSATGVVIYKYDASVKIKVSGNAVVGRAYVVLSTEDLHLKYELADITSEAQVLGFTFDIPATCFDVSGKAKTTAMETFLKNLYTTPKNKTYTADMLPAQYKSDPNYLGKYYGTVLGLNTSTPSLNIICYHVAAKLDLMWNVAEVVQETKKVTSMSVEGLYRKGCSLFNPAGNATTNTTDTYTQDMTKIDEGNQYYGRDAIYVIQKPTYQINIGVNGTTKTATPSLVFDSNVYTTWIRGFITIN